MTDLRDLGGDFIGGMNLIALDRSGEHVGMSSRAGAGYIYQTADMNSYEECEREVVRIPGVGAA